MTPTVPRLTPLLRPLFFFRGLRRLLMTAAVPLMTLRPWCRLLFVADGWSRDSSGRRRRRAIGWLRDVRSSGVRFYQGMGCRWHRLANLILLRRRERLTAVLRERLFLLLEWHRGRRRRGLR